MLAACVPAYSTCAEMGNSTLPEIRTLRRDGWSVGRKGKKNTSMETCRAVKLAGSNFIIKTKVKIAVKIPRVCVHILRHRLIVARLTVNEKKVVKSRYFVFHFRNETGNSGRIGTLKVV